MGDLVWRPIPGFEKHYWASSDGRIKSERKVLTPHPDKDGYLILNFSVQGIRADNQKVHVLVALTFLGPRPTGLEVCHRNSNRVDNRPDNLYYGTRHDQWNDRHEFGTDNRRERNGRFLHGRRCKR